MCLIFVPLTLVGISGQYQAKEVGMINSIFAAAFCNSSKEGSQTALAGFTTASFGKYGCISLQSHPACRGPGLRTGLSVSSHSREHWLRKCAADPPNECDPIRLFLELCHAVCGSWSGNMVCRCLDAGTTRGCWGAFHVPSPIITLFYRATELLVCDSRILSAFRIALFVLPRQQSHLYRGLSRSIEAQSAHLLASR